MQLYLGEEGKKYYWRVVDVSNIADVETLETKRAYLCSLPMIRTI